MKNIILDIHCCTTLLPPVIQSVCVSLEVTLEPILEAEVTLRISSISSYCCCISFESLLSCCSHTVLYFVLTHVKTGLYNPGQIIGKRCSLLHAVY
jgi:hypothetical protein